MRFLFITQKKAAYPVGLLCEVMQVSRSGYYKWLKEKGGKRAMSDETALGHIREVFAKSRQTYGRRRVTRRLRKMGIVISEKRVGRLMREAGLRAVGSFKFRATTNSKHSRPVAPNLLAREFSVASLNTAWVSDITYVPTSQGWLYLCVILDLASRRIVGWSMRDTMHAEMVTTALREALDARKPAPGLIFHSDRGVQYASTEVVRLLQSREVRQSMSRKGDCWDNAVSESSFATIKKELVYRCKFADRETARQALFEYLEVFYNRDRDHSALGYLTPEEFERKAA
ncbi:MAG: IS3 family transposase [Burkholderiaceae bacterium]